MGKSNKKIKPDRLAALRKQFEDFLEEDKKRKERNEFILGRLDKMRSNSLVPVKQAETLQERPLYRPAPIYQGSLLNKPQGHELQNTGKSANQQNITANLGSAGSALLQEIYKTYILIPRNVTATVTEYTNNAKVTDVTVEKENNDWKSKYHILDELKRADKEGLEPNSKNDNFPIKENQLRFTRQNTDTVLQETGHDQEPTLKYKEEVQEKENLYRQADYAIHNYPEKPLDNSDNKKYAKNYNDQDWTLSINNNPDKLYDTQNLAEKKTESSKSGNSFMPLYSSQTKLGYQVVGSNNNVKDFAAQDTYNSYPSETLDAGDSNTIGEVTDVISNEKAKMDNAGFQEIVNPQVTFETDEPHESKYKNIQRVDYREENQSVIQDLPEDEHQYPLEVINTQDYTPNEGIILKDGVNINPEGCPNENHINPSIVNVLASQLTTAPNLAKPQLATEPAPQPAPIKESEVPPPINEEDIEQPVVQGYDTEQIREFEEEQANMFYQEPDAVNDQITKDANYVQNQNESYQYYEGVEQEHYAPVEINEHEEATERYDPNYQTQYEQGQYDYTQQGYEQQDYEQQGYEGQEYDQSAQEHTAPQDEFDASVSVYNMNQLPQQYEETALSYDAPYEHEQGYDVQAVEQQLDNEQGYIQTEQGETETKTVEQEQSKQEQQNP